MKVVDAFDENRPRPVYGKKCHARLRHGGAVWHPDLDEERQRDKEFQKRELENIIPFHDRSVFHSARFIDEAIRRSIEFPAILEDGIYVVLVDMGFECGFDAYRDQLTRIATVVHDSEGEVLTVQPGGPKKLW
jgi:hypothetical protein